MAKNKNFKKEVETKFGKFNYLQAVLFDKAPSDEQLENLCDMIAVAHTDRELFENYAKLIVAMQSATEKSMYDKEGKRIKVDDVVVKDFLRTLYKEYENLSSDAYIPTMVSTLKTLLT